MITDYIEKTTTETWVFALKYEGRLPVGTTLVSGTVGATLANTSVVDNAVLGSTTTTIVGTDARATILAGVSSQDYHLSFKTTLSDGSVLEDTILLKVADT